MLAGRLAAVGSLGRLLLLVGAAGVVASAFMPWVTIHARVPVDLSWLGIDNVSPGVKTVNGSDTSIWPAVAGIGVVVAALALFNLARKLLLLLGLLIVVAGGALLFYVLNVVDIEASGAVERVVAGAALTSSAGAGPPVLLASGIAILFGALLRS
jgi:hypothetical protein